jgi:glycosyltransferase involved in cell wall biosynthesis
MTRRRRSASPQPFIVSGDGTTPPKRRLLLITPAFPPDPRSGSLRWQKLSRYIAARGLGMDVIMVDPAEIEFSDAALVKELPPGVRVFGVRSERPRLEQFVRRVWKILPRRSRGDSSSRPVGPGANGSSEPPSPNGRPPSLGRSDIQWLVRRPRDLVRAFTSWVEFAQWMNWARAAAALAGDLIEQGVHEAIITSGPPHMTHEAGRLAARATGLPFVMDMRDPWTLVQRVPEHIASPVWFTLAERFERRAVADAAIIATNTEPFRRVMCDKYPKARARIITVMNGYDEDALPPSQHGSRFVIGYAGAIYLDRDPRPLFRAASQVVRDLNLTPSDFGIEFIGHVESYGSSAVADLARQEGLNGYVTVGPRLPHRAVMEFQARATMLVSLPQDSDLAIPAKIFEYMRCEAWLLALATPESAVGLLLEGTAADVVSPGDVSRLTAVIRERVLQHRNGLRPTPIAQDERFSRRAQACRLLDAIADTVQRTPASPELVTFSR